MDEFLDTAPTERRGEVLPAGHPAANLAPAEGDCVAHISAEVKDAVATAHGNREPPDSPVQPEDLV